MPRILNVASLEGYRLRLTFDDGVEGIVDLARHVGLGVFSAWANPDEFRKVAIGTCGELTWGDTIDLCPDALYLEVTGKQPEDLFPRLKRVDANA